MNQDQFTMMDRRLLVPSLTNRAPVAMAVLQAMADTMTNGRGVRQALIVRPLPASRLHDTKLNTPKGQPLPTHEIVCGEQRWASSGLASVKEVPVLIRDLTDAEALEEQVIENVQRQNYTELEEGEAFQRLMQHPETRLTADQVAAKVGKSRRHVFHRLKLLDMRSETRAAFVKGEIDASRALLLARIPDHQQQIKALPILAKRGLRGGFELSLEQATDLVERDFMLELGKAKFKTTDITLLPDAGSCRTCSKRTGHDPDIFSDIKGADICTDPPCFHRKQEAHEARMLANAHANGQTVITGREAKALMPNNFGPIEGFLRLDDVKDSPGKKPLRQLIGKQLEADGIKPTLIDNPHKKGDMIAVLRADTVAELLKKRGHKEAAGAITTTNAKDAKANAAREKKEADEAKVLAYEQGWRDLLLSVTYEGLSNSTDQSSMLISPSVMRIIATRLAHQCNGEQTRQLCDLLGLGKIAPKQALLDHIKACDHPARLVLLLVMHHDVGYKPFLDESQGNEGLLAVATDYGIDPEIVKTEVKASLRATSKILSSGELRSSGGGGREEAAKPTTTTKSRKPKATAEETSAGIAVALQGLDKAAAPAAASLTVGSRVTVAQGGTRLHLGRFAGLGGEVIGQEGSEWQVKLDKNGRGGGTRLFEAGELVAAA